MMTEFGNEGRHASPVILVFRAEFLDGVAFFLPGQSGVHDQENRKHQQRHDRRPLQHEAQHDQDIARDMERAEVSINLPAEHRLPLQQLQHICCYVEHWDKRG